MKTYHDLISYMLTFRSKPVPAIVGDRIESLQDRVLKGDLGNSQITNITYDNRFFTASHLPWNYAMPVLPDGTPLRVNLKHKLHEGN